MQKKTENRTYESKHLTWEENIQKQTTNKTTDILNSTLFHKLSTQRFNTEKRHPTYRKSDKIQVDYRHWDVCACTDNSWMIRLTYYISFHIFNETMAMIEWKHIKHQAKWAVSLKVKLPTKTGYRIKKKSCIRKAAKHSKKSATINHFQMLSVESQNEAELLILRR